MTVARKHGRLGLRPETYPQAESRRGSRSPPPPPARMLDNHRTRRPQPKQLSVVSASALRRAAAIVASQGVPGRRGRSPISTPIGGFRSDEIKKVAQKSAPTTVYVPTTSGGDYGWPTASLVMNHGRLDRSAPRELYHRPPTRYSWPGFHRRARDEF